MTSPATIDSPPLRQTEASLHHGKRQPGTGFHLSELFYALCALAVGVLLLVTTI